MVTARRHSGTAHKGRGLSKMLIAGQFYTGGILSVGHMHMILASPCLLDTQCPSLLQQFAFTALGLKNN